MAGAHPPADDLAGGVDAAVPESVLFDQFHAALGAVARFVLNHLWVHRAGVLSFFSFFWAGELVVWAASFWPEPEHPATTMVAMTASVLSAMAVID
jgi:hypothetical protein